MAVLMCLSDFFISIHCVMALVFWDDEIIKREIVLLLEQMKSIE